MISLGLTAILSFMVIETSLFFFLISDKVKFVTGMVWALFRHEPVSRNNKQYICKANDKQIALWLLIRCTKKTEFYALTRGQRAQGARERSNRSQPAAA